MIVLPGRSAPDASAASIMDLPMRSLIEPPGFWLSSFRNSRHGPASSFFTSCIGVLPIASSTLPKTGGAIVVVVMRSPFVADRQCRSPAAGVQAASCLLRAALQYDQRPVCAVAGLGGMEFARHLLPLPRLVVGKERVAFDRHVHPREIDAVGPVHRGAEDLLAAD